MRPSGSAAASASTVASREWNAACKCSIRSCTHLTGRARRMASAATATSSGKSCIFGPKPPPTSGAITRMRLAAIPRLRARPSRSRCGTWVEEKNSRVPLARSQAATAPHPSMGIPETRGWRQEKRTRIGARSKRSRTSSPPSFSPSPFPKDHSVRNSTLPGACSWTRGAPLHNAERASAATGRGS